MAGFSVKNCDEGIYRLWEKKNVGVSEYLILGEDKAMLIDTGYGKNGLKEKVKSMTSLPLIVVNSHYHPDHSADNGQFDKVYIHPNDIPVNGTSDFQELIKKLVAGFKPIGKIIDFVFPPFDDSKVEYIPMNDGDVFDLGGRKITVHAFRGHTRGSVMFTDDKTSALFTNDCCNYGTWLFTDPEIKLSDYAESVLKLKEQYANIKKVYFAHVKKEVSTSFFTEYGAFLKKIPKALKIKLPLRGLDSPLCIAIGKLPTQGMALLFYFQNQMDLD